jgi:FdhD protein
VASTTTPKKTERAIFGRTSRARVTQFSPGARDEKEDRLAVEEPLEIRLQGKRVAVVMRSPGEDPELAAGFLYTEGILRDPSSVAEVRPIPDPKNPWISNVIDVALRPGAKFSRRGWQRNFAASSSCGLCGKLTIESVRRHAPALEDDLSVSPAILYSLPDRLRAAQSGFDQTGGLHAAGLFDEHGALLAVREDIGRHNAVDKLVGAALFAGEMPLSRRILLVSGRASFEIVQKALMARIPFVAAISAASQLAVELAQGSAMGLAGFLRGRSMNLYAGEFRVNS